MTVILSPNDIIRSYTKGDKYIVTPKFTAEAWEECYQILGTQLADLEEGRLLLTVGLPNSGKSTYIKEHPDLIKDYDVVFDGGFPNRLNRGATTNIAKGAGWTVDCLFLNTPYNICRNRNHRNENGQRIPFEAFKQVAKSFSKPQEHEKFGSIIVAYGYSPK